MYTNINCEHAIDVISTWFERLEYRRDNEKPNGMPPGFPTEAVLEALKIVMINNLFQWGDCFFLQLDGIEQTIVAFHRPPNLRDLIQSSKLRQVQGSEVSTYLGG